MKSSESMSGGAERSDDGESLIVRSERAILARIRQAKREQQAPEATILKSRGRRRTAEDPSNEARMPQAKIR